MRSRSTFFDETPARFDKTGSLLLLQGDFKQKWFEHLADEEGLIMDDG